MEPHCATWTKVKRNGRRRFTDEEKACIASGVSIFGKGKWVEILAMYPQELGTRSNVDIKDCYRTMKKQEERRKSMNKKEQLQNTAYDPIMHVKETSEVVGLLKDFDDETVGVSNINKGVKTDFVKEEKV